MTLLLKLVIPSVNEPIQLITPTKTIWEKWASMYGYKSIIYPGSLRYKSNFSRQSRSKQGIALGLLCQHSWTSHSIGTVSAVYNWSYDSTSLSRGACCYYLSWKPRHLDLLSDPRIYIEWGSPFNSRHDILFHSLGFDWDSSFAITCTSPLCIIWLSSIAIFQFQGKWALQKWWPRARLRARWPAIPSMCVLLRD